jgi:hypothetical protein
VSRTCMVRSFHGASTLILYYPTKLRKKQHFFTYGVYKSADKRRHFW